MSYDLRLCLPLEGRTREEIATSDDLETSPLGLPRGEPRRQSLAVVLMAAMPGLVRTDKEAPGHGEDIDVPGGEMVVDPPVVELTAVDDASGLQITIADREAGLSVPFGHGPDPARGALAAMWRCAEILEREGGFFTYDQQAGRVLDLARDFELVASLYGRAQERISRRETGDAPADNRPRWIMPSKLDRVPYLLHWLGLTTVTLGLLWGTVLLTRGSRAELLALVPAAAGFIAKMLVIDPARLRSIGWPASLTFLSLFPPAAVFLQLLLFFLSPRSPEERS